MIFSAVSWSQNQKADSLVSVLQKTKNDIDKVRLLNAIADEYKSSNPNAMIQYANQALQLSVKIKYKSAEGNAYINIGNANIIKGNYTEALRNFSNAQAVFEDELNNNSENTKEVKECLARAYGSIGIVFSEQSIYAKALQYELKALKIYEETQNLQKCARLYNNVGIIYKSQDADFKALSYFVKCLKIQEKIGDETVGITMTNIGNIYLHQKKYPKALEYYTKAQQLFAKYPNPRGLGELYNNLGLYYKLAGNTSQALKTYDKAIVAFTSIEDKFGIADTYFYIGDIYFEQNKLDESLVATNKSLTLAKELNVIEQVQNAEKRLS